MVPEPNVLVLADSYWFLLHAATSNYAGNNGRTCEQNTPSTWLKCPNQPFRQNSGYLQPQDHALGVEHTHIQTQTHTHLNWTETTFRILLWNASVVTTTLNQKPNPSRVQWKKRISSWCSVLMRQMLVSPVRIRFQHSRIQVKFQLPDWTSVTLSSDWI